MTNSFNMSNWRRKYALMSETNGNIEEDIYQDNKMLIMKSILKNPSVESETDAEDVFNIMQTLKLDQSDAIEHYLETKADYEAEKGGEREDDTMPDDLMEVENPIDVIIVDVPLFIRMLEFAREDASTDMDLHDLAQKAIKMSAKGEPLTMMHYDDLVAGEAAMTDAMSLYEKYYRA